MADDKFPDMRWPWLVAVLPLLPPAEGRVATAIASFANHDDGAGIFAAQQTFADTANASRSAAQRATKRLQALHALIPDGREPVIREGVRTRQTTVRYRLAMPDEASPKDDASIPASDEASPKDDASSNIEASDDGYRSVTLGRSTTPSSRPPVTETATARPPHASVTAAERDDGYSITEENVLSIFEAWHHLLRYGRRVGLTPARREVICHVLRERRGTVKQIREAIANVADACPDRENQRCTDLPHILHRDRLPSAIADEIDDDWTHSPFGDGDY